MIRINNEHPRLDEFMDSGNDKLHGFLIEAKREMKYNLNDMLIIDASIENDVQVMREEMNKIRKEYSLRFKRLCNEYLHECDYENKLKEAGL